MANSSQRNMPLISVVIAVYNGVETLARCLESVITQTYENWELVIIDGGSKDGTQDVIKRYGNHVKYWVSEPDKGVYHAWNKALDHADGEWLIFLGADDYLFDEQVFYKSSIFFQNVFPEYRVVYGKVAQVDRKNDIIRFLGEPWSVICYKMKTYMKIPHMATFQHHSLFDEHGVFCEDFKIAGDYEFLMRELVCHPAFFMDGLVVSAMQVGGLSASPANNIVMIKENQLARKMRGINFFSFYYPCAYLKNYFRLFLWNVLGEKNAKILLDFWRKLTGRNPYWTRI